MVRVDRAGSRGRHGRAGCVFSGRQFRFRSPIRPPRGRILDTAGFVEASFTDVHEPVYYGPDVAAALDWIRGFASVNDVLKRLDPASTERALERLRQTLAEHLSGQGVWFDSRAWIVTASRR